MPTQAELEQLFASGTKLEEPNQDALAAAFQAGQPVPASSSMAVAHQPLTADQRAEATDTGDRDLLTRYTQWSMSKEQRDPVQQARVLRVASVLRERGGPVPDFFYLRDHIDEYERGLQGEDWAALAQRHPTLAQFGLDPSVSPLLADDSTALSGLAKVLGGWEVRDPGDPKSGYDRTSLVDVAGLPRLKTAPGWAKYLRDGAMAIGRSLLTAERAAGIALPTPVADPSSPLGVRLTTQEEAAKNRDAVIEQLTVPATAYYEGKFGQVAGRLVGMAPLIAGDTASRLGGAALGAELGMAAGLGTGPAAPLAVPLFAAAGSWAGSWIFNTMQSVGDLQERIAQVDDGTGQPLGMERARPLAWAAAQTEGAIFATGLGRAARGMPVVGEALAANAEKQLVVQALAKPTVLGALTRAGKEWGTHVAEGTATMVAASAASAAAPELVRAQYGGEADWKAVGRAVEDAAKRAAVDMAILTAWGPGRAAIRDVAQARRYGAEQVQLAAMRAAAKDSKLFSRSEEAAVQAADALLQDLPDAPQKVYADVGRWDAEAQARGLDPRQLAADVVGDGGAAYDAAKAIAGDLAIPTAKALVKVMRTEMGDALAQDLKLDPAGLTLRQTVAEKIRVSERVKELAATGADQLTGEARTIYDQERRKAFSALQGTGAEKSADQVADAHARLAAAQAVALSERYGGTALEWYDRLGLSKTEIAGPLTPRTAPIATPPEGGPPPGPDALEAPARRGEFRIKPPEFGAKGESYVIDLSAAADRTTLAHETAHQFTHVLGKITEAADAPAGLKADYQTLLGVMGFATHAERLAARDERIELNRRKLAGEELSADEAARLKDLTAREERLSHLWEQYLADGKAPTAELAGVFRRFKNWMGQAYRSIGGPLKQFAGRFKQEAPLELTPEVRGVFDRLLATDEELATAERAAGAQPFEAAVERMTPAERTAYESALGEARRAAEEALAARVTEANAREDAQWFRDERDRLKAEVEAELDASPLYRGLRILQEGTAPGLPDSVLELLKGEDGSPPKLDRKALVDAYGRDFVKTLPKGILSEKGKTGLSADDVATALGFESGDALVRALQAADPRAKVVEGEARARLEQLYGPALTENREALAEAALEAVHTPEGLVASIKAMAAMARQLGPEALARVKALSPDMLQAYAGRVLSGRPMEELSAARFLRSERSASDRAREAYKAGRLAEGLKEHEASLVYRALYAEAVRLKDQVERNEAKVRQATGDPWRQALGKAGKVGEDNVFRSSWRDASDALLEAVGIGAPPEPGQVRVGFDAMVQEAAESGATLAFDVDAVRELLQARKPWKELTPEEAQLVADAVVNIRRAANAQNEFTMLDKSMTRDDVVGEMERTAAEARSKTVPAKPFGKLLESGWAKAGKSIQALDALLLSTETMADMLGGGDRTSIFHKVFVDGYLAARNRKEELAREYGVAILEKFDRMPKEMRRRLFEEIDLSQELPLPPELVAQANLDPSRWTRSQLLMIALNMGNAGNKQRLLDGYGWTEKQVLDALGKHLSRAELEFTQDVVNSLEGLWPQISQLHERETGLPPGKIVAKPWKVELADGDQVELAGGYFPAKYDPRPGMSQRGQAAQEKAAQGLFAPNSIYAATQKGHTKSRAVRVEDVIDLDWGVVPAHVNSVLHDLAFRSYVRQTAALLVDPRVESIISKYLGEERWKQFVPWLQSVANEAANVVPAHERGLNRVFNELKGRGVTATLGHSISNMLGDLANPAMAWAAGEVGVRDLAIATARMLPWRAKATMEWAQGLSPELRFRSEKATSNLQTELGAMAGEAGKTSPTLRAIRETAFWGQEWTDRLTATPTWVAKFNAELRRGASETEAAKTADATVRRLFPAETAAEKAAIFRSRFGGWLVFYGYMNKLYQVKRGVIDEAYRTYVDPTATIGEKGLTFAKAAGQLFAIATVMAASDLASNRGKDKDESWADWATRKAAASPFQELPWVGPLAEAAVSKAQGKQAKVTMRAAPGFEAGLSLARKLEAAGKNPLSEEGAAALIEAIGFMLNVPTRQAVKTGKYALGGGLERDLSNGEPGKAVGGLIYGNPSKTTDGVVQAITDAGEALQGQ